MTFLDNFFAKMSKTTYKQHLQLLLTLMEAHPALARGFYKGSKEDLARFWRKVAIGPPIKNITDWKKVWADQKKYVRQKAAQNVKAQKGTGGGPNTQHSFSAYEEGIYNLMAMKNAVGGVPVNTFGLGSSSLGARPGSQTGLQKENSVCSSLTVCLDEDIASDEDLPFQIENEIEVHYSESPLPNKSVGKASLSHKKYSPSAALQEELHIQTELCEAVKNAVVNLKEHQENTKEIQRSLDRLHDLQKTHFEKMENLKESELKEMKRHNLSMEKIRMQKLNDKAEKPTS